MSLASALPPAVQRLLPALGPEPVWLVGGCVRDLLLGRPIADFDFAVQGDGLALGRRLANELGADYFDLDPSRRTGRLLLTADAGRRVTFDFAALRGGGIQEDLAGRDFTVNAMAIPLAASGEAGALVDPLGGAQDLRDRRLRACSADSIGDDPVRAVRAARLSVDLGFHLEPATIAQVRGARTRLGGVSPERLRDELFRLLESEAPATGLRLLDHLGLLDAILPELAPLRGLEQPPPHTFDGLDHALATVEHLARLSALLTGRSGKAEAGDLTEAEALVRLGPFQQDLARYLDFAPSYGRPRRGLALWAALVHDGGKPKSLSVDSEGRARYFGHETIGARIAVAASRRLRLSTVEQAEVEMVVLHHMRPEWLEGEPELTRRAVYRFYRAAESTGPAVVLLSLADLMARYVPPLPEPVWQRRLEVAQELLRAWFQEREERVTPQPLLDGDEIMQILRLRPGPEVGRILEGLREAQAAGEVSSRSEAARFVEDFGAAEGRAPREV